jgi:galactokinase/mevalonate kinase-like predicted kinase
VSLPKRITASTPGRVDIGGRIDIPELFCQFPSGAVGTCNIAIDLRTTVCYSSGPPNAISVRLGHLNERSDSHLAPDGSALPYFWMVIREFRAPWGTYAIDSDIPRGSGLGGSSALVVALLSIVATAQGESVFTPAGRDKLIMRAYQFENGTGLTSAGFQDYLAAFHGGMNHWSWGATDTGALPLDARRELRAMDTAMGDGTVAVAFTGDPHPSNHLRGSKGRLRRKDHEGWLRIGELVRECVRLLDDRRWPELADVMMAERTLWVQVTGEPMSARVAELLEIADALGIAARFAGVPTGGSVWAIGSPADIAQVVTRWRIASSAWPQVVIRTVGVDRGLTVVLDV